MRRNVSTRAVAVLALAILVAGALAATTAGAAKKPLTKKRLAKVSNAVSTFIDGPVQGGNNSGFDLDAANSVIASLTLPKGNYVVSADFDVFRNNAGLVTICHLRFAGKQDEYGGFHGGATQLVESAAMSMAGSVGNGAKAELRCDDGSVSTSDSSFSNINLNAIEVPKLTIV